MFAANEDVFIVLICFKHGLPEIVKSAKLFLIIETVFKVESLPTTGICYY